MNKLQSATQKEFSFIRQMQTRFTQTILVCVRLFRILVLALPYYKLETV